MRKVLPIGRRMPVRCAFVIATVVASVLVLLAPVGQVADANGEVPIPGIGATCAACHAEASAEWATSIHRRTVSAPHIPSENQGCAACHPTASDHLADPIDESKRPSLAGIAGQEITEMCLACHTGGQQSLWVMSSHATTEDSCLTCHDPHGGVGTSMLKASEPELCRECHATQVAEGSLPSHHPIAEGKLVCSDCHNVHGEQRGGLGEASTPELCYKCHGEKAGPFQFEHPPVTEDCATCHKPHGSQNNYLLVQDQPLLCLQCHPGHHDGHRSPFVTLDTAENAELATQSFYERCTSCHSRIHGTDLPSGTDNGTFMPGAPLSEAEAAAYHGSAVSAASMDASLWGFSEIDFGRFEEEDNPNYVREYDGRNNDVPAFDLELTKFGDNYDYRLQAKDLGRGDQDISLRFGNNIYDVQVNQSGLTHRIARYNDPADGAGIVDIPGNAVEVEDRANGRDNYHLSRTTFEVKLAARHPNFSQVKWIANAWEEAETGSQQFLFLERCTNCHKVQVSEPIDRKTTITQLGFEWGFDASAIRYVRENRSFDNRAPEMENDFPGVSSVYSGLAPLFGVAGTSTRTDDVRAASQLSERLSASALYRRSERDDRLAGGELDVHSAGGGLNWRVAPDLRVGASFVTRSLDPSNVESGVIRDRDTARVNVRYTGLSRSTLALGYANEQVDREAIEHGLIPTESDSDVWRATLISRLTPKTRLQLNYRNTKTDQGAFFDTSAPPEHFPSRLIGMPDDATAFSGVLTYNWTQSALLSAIYSKYDKTYEVNVPDLGIARSSEQDTKTAGLQLVYRPDKRASLRASYYSQEGSTRADTTYGAEDYVLEPPVVPADVIFPPFDAMGDFDYDANVAQINGSFWATSRLRLFGRWSQTNSDGRQTAHDLGDYFDQDPDHDGVDVVFNPFDIDISDTWVGVGYLVDPRSEVTLSYQRRSWENSDDPTQDGSYDFWRLGIRGQF